MSRLGQHDVGHEGIITGCDGFSLRSSIADPQGVAQSPLQSPTLHSVYLLDNLDHFFQRYEKQNNERFIRSFFVL
ncbi:hypothetical protein ACQKMI_21050 [Lysinibacillus sp. NPDC097214]|uniref:hypothetical protein n=1 Tax=Lysinibacillus sp. NPDC097214 TaxID=3390584 RepID=UPI003D002BE4